MGRLVRRSGFFFYFYFAEVRPGALS